MKVKGAGLKFSVVVQFDFAAPFSREEILSNLSEGRKIKRIVSSNKVGELCLMESITKSCMPIFIVCQA
jgi:hypothetical protein